MVDFPPDHDGRVSYFCGFKNLVEAKYAEKWDKVDPSLNHSQRLMGYDWPSEREVDTLIAAGLDDTDHGQNRRLDCDEKRLLTEREKELTKCMLAAEMVTMVKVAGFEIGLLSPRCPDAHEHVCRAVI